MLLNYLKLAIRLLIRNPFFTFINVAGLSIGFAAFFGLWQFASSELQSDQYHPGYDRIVRFGTHWTWTDDGRNWGKAITACIGPAMTHQISLDFPEVESYNRILHQPQFLENLVGHDDHVILSRETKDGSETIFKETKAAYADPNIFEFFSIPLIKGKPADVLKNANSIVLSQQSASRFFGNDDPVGELLVLNGKHTLKVTGVFQDLPHNTHLSFDFVISNAGKINEWNNWIWFAAHSYVMLKKGSDLENFKRKIATHDDKYFAEILRVLSQSRAQMFLQPLEEVAFSKDYFADFFMPKSRLFLQILQAVSILILLMAWVNYINLTITRSIKRIKEVGARKALGAGPADFMKQFLIESTLINVIAVALAFTLLQVLRTPAELLLHIPLSGWSDISVVSKLIFITAIIALITFSGLYASRASLNARAKDRTSSLSGTLTTFQYTVAIVLMVCVLSIAYQLDFILGKAIGLNKDRVAVIEAPVVRSGDFEQKIELFKNRLTSESFMPGATFSKSVPGDDYTTRDLLFVKKSPDAISVGTDSNGGVNEDFIPFFDIRILAGRNFRADDRGDVVLLSRVAINRLGYNKPQEVIGSRVQIGDGTSGKWTTVEVIGIIEDYRIRPYFNFTESSSLDSEEGRGICLTFKTYLFAQLTPEKIAVKFRNDDHVKTIPAIEQIFKELFPGNSFNLYFLDDHMNRHYSNEKILRNQILFFTMVAIGIACLGLLGMISAKVVEKTKEIGIRKVMGAGIFQILRILVRSTVNQVFIATAIGIPAAYYLVHQYLNRFSERIDLQWWHYAAPLIALMTILVLTISSVLWKAIRTNPIESLRYE
jgi:putative ABC transport system permease protein